MIVLDTDHLRVLQSPGAHSDGLKSRLNNAGVPAVSTVVNLHELVKGWQDEASRARTADDLVRHYVHLSRLAEFVGAFDFLPFDAAASDWWATLQRRRLGRIKPLDLRIAAIVLATDAELLLTGDAHFDAIEELRGRLADWRYGPIG